jgi:tetratricopeptide (TPR) repeat protein
VSQLIIGLLSAMMSTNQPVAVSNFVTQTTGVSVAAVANANDPAEKAYRQLLELDESTTEEVDKWIRDAQEMEAKTGAAAPNITLNAKIRERLEGVKSAYEKFLEKNPNHVKAWLAYGSFLGEVGQEGEAAAKWEKARELDPTDPAAWNNLANYYGHKSPVKKAFEYYAKAIELNPNEAVYYHNFGTTVFLFRKDAKEYYGIEEQQVFDKALELYRKSLKLDPDNFLLAQDIAQTYYGIKPQRNEEAIKAWDYALSKARDDFERQGVHIHLARFKLNEGKFNEARTHLSLVTHENYGVLKERVTATLERKEKEAKGERPDEAH